MNLRGLICPTPASIGVTQPAEARPGASVPGDPDNSYLIHKLEGRADIAGAAHAAQRHRPI